MPIVKYTLKEFAKQRNYEEETLRQQCRGQLTGASKTRARLPFGCSAYKEGNRWFIEVDEPVQKKDKMISSLGALILGLSADHIDQQLNERLAAVMSSMPVAELGNAIANRWAGRWNGPSFQDPGWFFEMIGLCADGAVTGKRTVKCELTFERNGDWGVLIDREQASLSLLTLISRMRPDRRLQAIAKIWNAELTNKRNGRFRNKPSIVFKLGGGGRTEEVQIDYKSVQGTCLACGKENRRLKSRFCADRCKHSHQKFMTQAANQNDELKLVKLFANRVAKIRVNLSPEK